ncbi:MAG: hypothetical protein AVDCRST_MAG05-4513, partial [uncultured Rubrobacteraceae bacterium]
AAPARGHLPGFGPWRLLHRCGRCGAAVLPRGLRLRAPVAAGRRPAGARRARDGRSSARDGSGPRRVASGGHVLRDLAPASLRGFVAARRRDVADRKASDLGALGGRPQGQGATPAARADAPFSAGVPAL